MNDIDVKELRNGLNLTQSDFAKRLGVDIKTVQNWESGRKISATKRAMLENLSVSVKVSEKPQEKGNGIPFYENLPVSAGQADLIHITQGEHPTGYISLPGVSAIAAFPVVGCSMEPEIKPGDFIAVSPMTSLDSVDPDKTYMIITDDDRMIKHLLADPSDPSILWAHSPNYPRFPIQKTAIKALYKIQFHGRIL